MLVLAGLHFFTNRNITFLSALKSHSMLYPTFTSALQGWSWSANDRLSFEEIHQDFDTMFHDSSISDG